MSMIECRICENCGTRNPVNVLECIKCSYDLSMVPPVRVEENQNVQPAASNDVIHANCWQLSYQKDPNLTIDISNSIMIGRDEEPLMSYGHTSTFISREHATLSVQGDALYVLDASTNGTYINGERLRKLVQTPVQHGDVITFADMDFRVQ